MSQHMYQWNEDAMTVSMIGKLWVPPKEVFTTFILRESLLKNLGILVMVRSGLCCRATQLAVFCTAELGSLKKEASGFRDHPVATEQCNL